MSARLGRLAGLVALWAGVELLERTAYRAGIDTGRAVVRDDLDWLAEHEDLEAFDASDVLEDHGYTAA